MAKFHIPKFKSRCDWRLLTRRSFSPILWTAIAFVAAACADVVHGDVQPIKVLSQPPGAAVTVDGDYRLTTPTEETFSRGQDHTLTFHKDGYEDITVRLTRSISGWVLGSAAAGGILGVADAYATGAAFNLSNENLSDDTLSVKLTPQSNSVSAPVRSQRDVQVSQP